MARQRVRVVKGSCWPCKKRRVKCDLEKPGCQRCSQAGTPCNYNTHLIRWSNRPSVSVEPVKVEGYQKHDFQITTCLFDREQRALAYFHVRVWPLLSTAPDPPAPFLENRVILLATCVFAATHRYLQEGQGKELITPARSDCIVALRLQVQDCSKQGRKTLLSLLLAVLLLYIHDGLVEGSAESATATHHAGAMAILKQLGGITSILGTCHDSMSMMLSEFASADLTTALLQQSTPAFAAETWDMIDLGPVWWARDPLKRCSLAAVFREMSSMATYLSTIQLGIDELSTDRVREFEASLGLIIDDADGINPLFLDLGSLQPSHGDIPPEEAFLMIQVFQQSALVFLYRAICGMAPNHPLVQQHVEACLDSLENLGHNSSILHCIIFPLYVCGAHAMEPKRQLAVARLVEVIYDSMRFASVRAIGNALRDVWRYENEDSTWSEMFQYLSPSVIVL
ncbi:hypothetical protein BU24DRAFT_211625 [Aaosphaeria arxii CBS 175.79]|uniref:Zn(2)-C6 fungal-type domain-containing protein n=1 Tax=Aaosphaeria arxii CBS 175.79 TaxID=1450172 RepID=A0A6A5XLT1_9PLEO|nr:uncharacterized protein BU24DRAFT_211625 [Aaosphaeria arxii CBS 175.79]KAF2014195.1 hypothetical protein BU24DRAFT_211625 [Aaosphaeria arxii CBS 175.79]